METGKLQEDAQTESTSGYVEQLDKEMDAVSDMQVQHGFGDLQEFYASPGGHTRLFYASRYGKKYVLKCLKADYLYPPLYRQALAKEFEIGLQLDHPCICRTIGMEDIGLLGPAIVMERVDGCTLKELIERQALTKPLARKLAGQVADAMGYLHSRQTIHRDLKPSNIMVTHNGHDVKLIDFSLADGDAFNVLKQPAGTSGYIAPEQLQPGAKADVRADIYSLGKVMEDMSRATGDRLMGHVAALCMRRDAAKRPPNVARLKALARQTRTQARLLATLSVLAVLAGTCAAWAWHHRQIQVQETENVHNIQPDGNQAADYTSWPKVMPPGTSVTETGTGSPDKP